MSHFIGILDTTLRLYEPSAGIDFSLRDKLDIAAELAKTGVDVIEVGQPAVSPAANEAVRRVAEAVRTSRIGALARCIPSDIEVAADALAGAAESRLHVYLGLHEPSHPSPRDRSEAIMAVGTSVRMARNLVADVEFSLQDATRADAAFLAELVRTALAAGASTINLPDVGFVFPDELTQRIVRLRHDVPELEAAVLSFHGHDDLGLATANAIAAVRAGARQIEGAINGLGGSERNTPIEEVVTALRVRADFLRVTTRVDANRMGDVCRLVEERTGSRSSRWRQAAAAGVN